MSELSVRQAVCRVCGGGFDDLLSLGPIVLCDFLAKGEPNPPAVPLTLVQCQECGLVQLDQTTDPEKLYRKGYWYRSGINETMVAELTDIVAHVRRLVPLTSHHTVLDIGANDGTLLRAYADADESTVPCRIAVEPARSVEPFLRATPRAADLIFPDFFPTPALADGFTHAVSAITSIACLYDLQDPIAFVQGIDRLLTADGVWIVQMQDLRQMLDQTAYDNICHEHLCYYSLGTLERLLAWADVDLHVTHVIPRAINGGSLRFVLTRTKRPPHHSVWEEADTEKDEITIHALDRFAARAFRYAEQLHDLVTHLASVAPVGLYAASTKSSTLLQAARLSHREIVYAIERTPEKIGRVTSGTLIPIVGEAVWRTAPTPATLIGAWQFRDAFLVREAKYLADGGIFLFPLPTIDVVFGGRVDHDDA